MVPLNLDLHKQRSSIKLHELWDDHRELQARNTGEGKAGWTA